MRDDYNYNLNFPGASTSGGGARARGGRRAGGTTHMQAAQGEKFTTFIVYF